MKLYEAIETRRSYYGISNEQVISDEKLQEVVERVVKHTPSAFNSQSARLVVLLGEEHKKLWNMAEGAVRKIVPEEKLARAKEKIHSFRSGYGTVLFFEDTDIVKGLQERFPSYKHNFPTWSKEASGMHQINLWNALEAEGYGVSLQHYTELIEESVKKEWKLPEHWEMRAQMPFGKPIAPVGEKEYKPLEERVKIFK